MSPSDAPADHQFNFDKLKINWPSPEKLQIAASLQNIINTPQIQRLNELGSEAIKNIRPFPEALSTSKAFSSRLPSIASELNLASRIILNDVAQYAISSFQPQLFEAAQQVAASVAKLDFSKVGAQYQRLYDSQRYLELLRVTQWPLYLLDQEELLADIGNLKASMDNQMLRDEITECAMRHLESDWLKETRERWSLMGSVESSKKELLFDALSRHENGDYRGCVSILMCLFEGFIENYAINILKSTDIDPELFDWAAEKRSLRPLCPKPNKYRSLNAKDHIIVFWLQTDRGWYIWREASNYLIDVILANQFDAETAAHNPLRNKICHGEQTHYDTWEHSAKAILATDIVLRLGAAASAAIETGKE